MLACVREGLAAVSRELCGALRGAGLAPVAFAEGVVDARRVPALGLVGEPLGARADAIWQALARRAACPVVAPLGRDASGALLNINADDAAAAIATALGADELIFLSDVPGVLDERGAVLRADLRLPPAGERRRGHAAEARGLHRRALGGVSRVSIGVAGTVVTP